MNEEQIYNRLIENNIAVKFSNIDSFRIFCGFLHSKKIPHKQPISYYWGKYGNNLCVSISEKGGFKCGSDKFYTDAGKEIYIYDKKPYIVNVLEDDFVLL